VRGRSSGCQQEQPRDKPGKGVSLFHSFVFVVVCFDCGESSARVKPEILLRHGAARMQGRDAADFVAPVGTSGESVKRCPRECAVTESGAVLPKMP
jgi:hypothetical protein